MKTKILATSVVVLLLVSMLVGMVQVYAIKPGDPGFTGIHFNLNLHGVPDGRNVPSDGEGRHSIFVPLNGDYELYIAVSGLEWRVTDCDGTDGEVRIILPREIWEDVDEDGDFDIRIGRVKYYNVYVVGLGKPGEASEVILNPDAEFDYQVGQEVWRLDELIVPGHRNGKTKGNGGGQPDWQNATDLFFVDVTILPPDADSVPIEYTDTWVFDIEYLLNYWWDVSNNDIGLMQVRFYPVFSNGNGNGNGKA